jgi:hypothetical protein
MSDATRRNELSNHPEAASGSADNKMRTRLD